jgi:hypothetical protein
MIQWADDNPEKVKDIIDNMTKIAPTRRDAVNQVKKLIALYTNGHLYNSSHRKE